MWSAHRPPDEGLHLCSVKEVGRVLNLSAARLVPEIEPIADDLAAVKALNNSVLIYTQSLLDSYRAQVAVRKTSTSEI